MFYKKTEFLIFYTYDSIYLSMECFACNSTINVANRQFNWHYRPKAKYNESDSWEILEVDLCSQCYNIVYNYSVESGEDYLIGWDWWDAYDPISWTIEDHHHGLLQQH